jgi:hypothetical protein
MTLDEIRARCIDNFWLLAREFKDYIYDTPQHAIFFVSECQVKAMAKLGVKNMAIYEQAVRQDHSLAKDEVRQRFYAKRLDDEMKRRGVKIEHLQYGQAYRSMMKQAKLLEQHNEDAQADFLRNMAATEPDQRPEDWVRTGCYIWKGQYVEAENGSENIPFIYDEIAYFISDPIVLDASKLATVTIVLPGQNKYMVRTNVPM